MLTMPHTIARDYSRSAMIKPKAINNKAQNQEILSRVYCAMAIQNPRY